MNDASNKPSIRFKGFTDAWEQVKLNQIVDYHASSLAAKDALSCGKYELYDANNFIGYTDKFFVDSDYITIIKDGAGVGRIRKLPKNTAFIGTMGAMVAQNSELDFDFALLEHCDLGGKYVGTTIPHIYFKNYGEETHFIPNIEEQNKIGNLFKFIDSLATLHQRKLEKLQNIKKALLQKMFPAEGEDTPKIRFKGFTDAWEHHSFKNLYNEASEGGTPSTSISSYYENGTIPFVKIEDTNNKYIYETGTHITDAGMHNSSAWLIPENSVIFTNGATVGNVAINKVKVTTKQGILGIIPSPLVNYEFLYYLLSSQSFQKEVRKRTAKGTFETIILNNLNSIEVLIPSSIDEQLFIAKELSNLDSLCTLHQRELEKLKEVKKALLQKMFI